MEAETETEVTAEPEPPKFSGKLESILFGPGGSKRVIYDGMEGAPEDFPLTVAELAEVANP